MRVEPTATQLNETQCRDECVCLFFCTNTNINVSTFHSKILVTMREIRMTTVLTYTARQVTA